MAWVVERFDRSFMDDARRRRQDSAKAFRRYYPRDGEPWKLSEDRKLLRDYDRKKTALAELPCGQRAKWWHEFSRPFKRTSQAVRTRLWGLQAGVRAAKGSKR